MPGFEFFGDLERKEVNDVLNTGVLMRYGFEGARDHYKAEELEQLISDRMNTNHTHLVSSGTAALTVALASAGVGAGDEVIMPMFTFVATFEAILSVGAIPVLANIDATLGLNATAVEKVITKRTKAIMPVHMCGAITDLAPLQELCKKHDLRLIEDACQAIGGTYNGKPLGTIGDVGCFSFDYVKTITCGEGGAIVTNNKELYTNAVYYSDHGHDHLGADRGKDKHPFLGYNYRISELHAAVGVAQFKQLDKFIEIQKTYFTIIEEALKSVVGLTFREIPEGGVQNYSFLSFFLPTKELTQKTHKALSEGGVDATFYWFDNNWHYHTKWEHLKELTTLGNVSKTIKDNLPDYSNYDYKASDEIISRTISCLIKLSWTEEEVNERAAKMVAILNGIV